MDRSNGVATPSGLRQTCAVRWNLLSDLLLRLTNLLRPMDRIFFDDGHVEWGLPSPPRGHLATISIDTGAVSCSFRKGPYLFDSLTVGKRTVAEHARLVAMVEDRSQASNGVLREVACNCRIENVTIEQMGPVRAVIKLDGYQATRSMPVPGGRPVWLPFTMRFYFYAGQPVIRMTHSFIFDGDPEKDFIKGLGITFDVPFQEELHNRHVRFVGDGTGVWCQPVRLLPG